MHYAKAQLLTDFFHYPKRGVQKKEQKRAARAKTSRKPKAPKELKTKPLPLTPEARKERERARFKRQLEEFKALGLCRHCREPAIEGQTRCQRCAEQHRVRRREDDRRHRAAAKRSEEKPTKEPTAQAPSDHFPTQTEQHHPGPHTKRQEYERLRRQPSGRQEVHRQSRKKRREQRRAAGLCKDCPNPAIPNQTRCEVCAERNRVARRKREAVR